MKKAVARSSVVVALLLALLPSAVVCQDGADANGPAWLFPGTRHFRNPVGDPMTPRFSVGLAYTNLFETRGPERVPYSQSPGSNAEVQAAVAVGVTVPLLRVAVWPDGGIVIGAQGGVFARFRIELPSRDDLGQDWVVGMPIEMAWNGSSARLRIIHRSSHLGDEFSASTGGQRIEVGGEAADLLLARRLGPVRLYGGAGWIFHSNTDDTAVLRRERRWDRYTVQAGADAEWQAFGKPQLSFVAGVDWKSAQRTNWRSGFALAAGVQGRAGTGAAALIARFTDGTSSLGQFFLTNERVISLEVVLGS